MQWILQSLQKKWHSNMSYLSKHEQDCAKWKNQTQKAIYYRISLIWNVQKRQIYKTESCLCWEVTGGKWGAADYFQEGKRAFITNVLQCKIVWPWGSPRQAGQLVLWIGKFLSLLRTFPSAKSHLSDFTFFRSKLYLPPSLKVLSVGLLASILILLWHSPQYVNTAF